MEDFIRKVNGEAKMVREKLNENRLAKGMTIENLSEKTGIPIGTLSKICSGHTNTSFDNIALIANALQCSMDEFSEFSGPATLEWEMNWVEKYRDLSEHGKRMIDRLMDLDIHLSKQVEDAKERLLCVWVPVTYMEDGMNYDTCHIRYLNVRDSVSLKDVDFGLQITSNAFMPVFYEGDIVLVSDRFPKPGEAGLFMHENLMYIRKYQITREGVKLTPVNMEGRFLRAEGSKQLSVQLCAGVICGVFRGEILMEYNDKE